MGTCPLIRLPTVGSCMGAGQQRHLLPCISGLPGSGEMFEVYMHPEQLALEPGETQLINCSTSCAQPDISGLETTLSKTLIAQGTQWKQYMVSNASQDTIIHCYVTCSGKQKLKSLNVNVFCECRTAGPSSPWPEPMSAVCLQSYCYRSQALAMVLTSLGSWGDKEQDPDLGLRICSHPSLASSLSLLATPVLRLAQRTVQARPAEI